MNGACGLCGGEEMHRVLVCKLKGRDCVEELSIDGRIILKWILKRLSGRVWTELIWLAIETSGRLL
jgi:hypothetical protein